MAGFEALRSGMASCAGDKDVVAGKDSGDATRGGARGTTLIAPPSTSLVHDQLE